MRCLVGWYKILSLFLQSKLLVVTGLSGISIYVILLWTTSVEWLQVSQFLFGLYMATEVAYYTYMYAKVTLHLLAL